MPHGSRLEYKLEVTDSFGTHLVEDPLNDRHASHPFGANSVLRGRRLRRAAMGRRPIRTCPPGGSSTSSSRAPRSVGRRPTSVYLPAGFTPDGERRYPLLVVHDGSDYLQYAVGGDGARQPDPPVATSRRRSSPSSARSSGSSSTPTIRATPSTSTAELVPALETELPLAGDAGRAGA